MTDVTSHLSKALRKAIVLALALPLATAGALPALAQDAAAGPDSGMQMGSHDMDGDEREMARGYRHDGDGDRDRARDRDRERERGDRRWHARAWTGERLAMRLAAAETAAGIKSAQLDAWRTFTAALVDFVTPERMPPGGPAAMEEGMMEPDSPEQPSPGGEPTEQTPPAAGPQQAQPGLSASGFLDRLIARAENRAEKAQKLKAAKTQLEAVLEPGQKETLERFFMPPRHHGGRR